MKLEAHLQEYLDSDFLGRAPKTVAIHRAAVEELLHFARGRLNHGTFTSFVKYAFCRWAPSTARTTLGAGARFLAWAHRMGYIDANPAKNVRLPPQIPTKPRAPFTPEEYAALREACKGTTMEWLIVLGWETGMAIGDCCLLKWKDVDGQKGVITIERVKTHEPCLIPIDVTGDCFQMLAAKFMEPRQPDWPNIPQLETWYVDPRAAARYITQSKTGSAELQAEFARVRARAGVDEAKTFHNLRATMLSTLANGGMQLAAACRVSGHRDPRIFLRYVTADVESIRTQIAQARAAVARKPTS